MDVLADGDQWRAGPATRPLRVATSVRSPSPIARPDQGARQGVRTAAARAVAAGHLVSEASPPYPATLINVWVRHWLAGVAAEAVELGLEPEHLEPRTRSVLARGDRLRRHGKPHAGPAELWRRRAIEWFADVDVLLTPVVARPAPAAGWGTRANYLRAYLNAARGLAFTQPWNLAGFPALSLPIGAGAVQLVAPPGRERALLQLASELTN
jgi:amidase